jgi:hypothetical protein
LRSERPRSRRSATPPATLRSAAIWRRSRLIPAGRRPATQPAPSPPAAPIEVEFDRLRPWIFKATGPLTKDTIVQSLYGGHAGQSLQTEQVLRFTSGSFVPRSARGEQSARKRFKLTVLCLNPPVHVGRALVARPGAQQRSQYLAVRRAAARLRGAFHGRQRAAGRPVRP